MTALPAFLAAFLMARMQRLLRDRTSLVFMFLVPFLLILVIGVTTASEGSGARPVGIVADTNLAPSRLAGRISTELEAIATLAWSAYRDEAALTAAIRRGELIAGVVIPASLDATVDAGGVADVTVLVDPGRTPPLDVTNVVRQVVEREAVAVRSERALQERFGVTGSDARRVLPDEPRTVVTRRSVGTEAEASSLPTGFGYTAPAYLVLFVFINVMVTTWWFPADLAGGVIGRTLVAPVSAWMVTVAGWTFQFLVGLLQAGVIVLVGGVLFGVTWGDPLAVVALVSAFTLVASSAGMLLAGFARSIEQVTSIAPPIGIALGMLGGCMWPLEIVGPLMQRIGYATPHAWALDAFFAVTGGGARLPDVLSEVLVLLGFAGVLLAFALIVTSRRLQRDARSA